ncbi:MAG: hypothetical protein HYU66_21545 [Armatimonadetes bacterium]|nr:hypothetical protein [Armatimonadota bacterium]
MVENDGAILLPMATLLETGNHIADVPGGQRYHLAELFAEIAGAAVAERPSRVEALALPVTPTYPLMPEHVRLWIHEFPEQAKQKGFGFADRSIIDAFHQTVRLNQGRHVFIWSTDSHLEKAEFDYTPTF